MFAGGQVEHDCAAPLWLYRTGCGAWLPKGIWATASSGEERLRIVEPVVVVVRALRSLVPDVWVQGEANHKGDTVSVAVH